MFDLAKMPRFTTCPEPEAERHIEEDLLKIIAVIKESGIRYHAVYLIGGFGRGEGAVRFNGERWTAINDYDLVIITDNCTQIRLILSDLGQMLAKQLKTDFVDLGCLNRDSLSRLPCTMQNYDFKYGSYLVDGNDVRDEVPDYQQGELPPYEMVRLLCNRAAGLLSSRLLARSQSSEYKANQIVKACIAAGDTAVYLVLGYHHLYRVRAQMFQELAVCNALPFVLSGSAVNAIQEAYITKLRGPVQVPFSLPDSLVSEIIASAYCAIAEHCTGKRLHTVSKAEWALRRHYHQTCFPSFRQLVRSSLYSLRHRDCTHLMGEDNIRNWILFAQPFFYCNLSRRILSQLAYLRRFATVPGALARPWGATSAYELWEVYCH